MPPERKQTTKTKISSSQQEVVRRVPSLKIDGKKIIRLWEAMVLRQSAENYGFFFFVFFCFFFFFSDRRDRRRVRILHNTIGTECHQRRVPPAHRSGGRARSVKALEFIQRRQDDDLHKILKDKSRHGRQRMCGDCENPYWRDSRSKPTSCVSGYRCHDQSGNTSGLKSRVWTNRQRTRVGDVIFIKPMFWRLRHREKL